MTSVDASTPEIRGSEFTSAAFVDRHVGPDADETARILALLGVESLDDLARRVVPSLILDDPSDNGLSALDAPLTEQEALERLSALASKNTVNRSMIGAVVGSQPFGGEGLSGTGPKAGGPHYLSRFCVERLTSTDTTSAGGNATLLSLDEAG